MDGAVLNHYLTQVEKYLPPWKAKEILKEIKSHILDQAEALAGDRGVNPDDAVVHEVINRLGPPEKLAEGYIEPTHLIRPEYTTHVVLYSGFLIAIFGLIFLFSVLTGQNVPSALGQLIISSLIGISIVFLVFVLLSRSSRIRHLPLWVPGFGVWQEKWGPGLEKWLVFKADIGKGTKSEQPPTEGSHPMSEEKFDAAKSEPTPTPPPAKEGAPMPGVSQTVNVATATPPPVAEKPAPPPRKLTLLERLAMGSAPRPLGTLEAIGAAFKIVFGLALVGYLLIADFPFSDFQFVYTDLDHPSGTVDHSWTFRAAFTGFVAIHAWILAGGLATALAGLTSIATGFSRIGLMAAILAKSVWVLAIVNLLVQESILLLDFQSQDSWAMRDWNQAQPFIEKGIPVVVSLFLLIVLVTMVGKIVRLNSMQTWYRMERDRRNREQKQEIL